jgi:hypothetical protein
MAVRGAGVISGRTPNQAWKAGLLEQHAQAIDRAVTALAGSRRQGSLQRDMDHVGHQGSRTRPPSIDSVNLCRQDGDGS